MKKKRGAKLTAKLTHEGNLSDLKLIPTYIIEAGIGSSYEQPANLVISIPLPRSSILEYLNRLQKEGK